MIPLNSTLRILEKANLAREIDAFLIDRRARALSPRTIDYYDEKPTLFRAYLQAQGIRAVESITAPFVRRFMLELSKTHNPGGVHAVYRAVKAFLRWYEVEVEPEAWSNPLRRVRPPRVPIEPLEPVPTDDIRAMVRTCARRTFFGDRDRAVLLCLLDTGCRAGEFAAIHIGDVDLATGQILIRAGQPHHCGAPHPDYRPQEGVVWQASAPRPLGREWVHEDDGQVQERQALCSLWTRWECRSRRKRLLASASRDNWWRVLEF